MSPVNSSPIMRIIFDTTIMTLPIDQSTIDKGKSHQKSNILYLYVLRFLFITFLLSQLKLTPRPKSNLSRKAIGYLV